MSAPALTYSDLNALGTCKEEMNCLTRRLGRTGKWNGRSVTAQEARDAGVSFMDIVWVASAVARTNTDVRRRLQLWMADCAARVLHIYERAAPGDSRVRTAIMHARRYARAEIDEAAWTTAKTGARDAAKSRHEPKSMSNLKSKPVFMPKSKSTVAKAPDAAKAVAHAASSLAPWPKALFFSDPSSWSTSFAKMVEEHNAAKEAAAWISVSFVATAAAYAAKEADGAVKVAEEAWQFDRLIAWLSDPEPADWPLPELAERSAA